MEEILGKLAPTIASALLGPFAGFAVAGLGKIFGIDNATQESVAKIITDGKMTPEQLAAIQKLELEYQDHEAERGFKYSELEFKNTADARAMKVATGSYFPEILSTFVTLGFFGILGWMLFDDNVVNSEPILIMLGSLGAAFGAVINYWLGSNKGSDRTKELLAQSAPIGGK